jgi:type I restriction enzyme S subunit
MLVPKLRFKREDGTDYPEWNKDKWLSLGNFVSSGTLSKSDLSDTGTPCILYGELYTKYGEVAHTIYSKTSAEVHTFSQADDVILPKSGETPEDISTATCIPFDSISLGGDLIVFRHNEKVIGRYLSYLISNRTKNAIASIAQGKSVVHINEKSLSNIVLPYPVIEEQQKIADFFFTVGEVITQSEAEVQNLEQQKKSAMQKIFSQELRFKREDGSEYPEWEETLLGKIGEVAMCKRILKEQTSDKGDVPFFKISTFGRTPDAYITYQLFEEFKKTYRFPQKGAVLISAAGTVGKIVRYNGEDAYYQDSNIVWLEHNDKVTDDFLYQFYQQVSWKGLEGSTIKRLYNKNLLETSISLPCFEEQQKIADFLSALDEAINYAKQELDKWKELKKGLLQQMFV